jgi:TPR repeat protein
MAVYGPDMLKAVKAQRAKHGIIFGPRDTVIGLSYEKAEADYLGWLLNVGRKKNLENLCQAANAGYPEAQAIQAARYRYGLWDTESQPVQAYVWLRLAELGGHPEAREAITDMTTVMRPDDVSEADRLFSNWSPSSCEP